MTVATPTLRLERELLREHAWVIACDEVGRGAIAGPVVVGAAFLDASGARKRVPEGLRDSKLIAEPKRADVAARAAAWVQASALGWASAQEVDQVGIIRALGLAALRAIDGLAALELTPSEGIVLLDGNHDYISPAGGWAYRVRPVIKGDRDCASASAASVLAKVERDAYMTALHEEEPVYGWDHNKGYASQTHRDAITAHGISRHHRASWAFQGNTLF
ncbi:ribonuclease HII [Microbacterium gorillae]|uniref:ribonuclease HII n=1 Tax=Microbacterium gorillae TaxID=1231063 RepID=UPI00058C9EBE|nr:ribonuclease HII [Microbacterium gorillae]